MNNQNCNTGVDCTFLSLAASVVVGIAVAILQFTAIITVGTVFPWVALGVALVFLLAALAVVPDFRSRDCCVCRAISVLIAAILGVVLTALVLLGFTFAATSVIGAIVAGLLLGFFTLLITSATCLLKCAVCSDDEE